MGRGDRGRRVRKRREGFGFGFANIPFSCGGSVVCKWYSQMEEAACKHF